MEDRFPLEESVYVLKEGQKRGPFDLETLFDGLEGGEFDYDDICLRAGATECERLREILDWESSGDPSEIRPVPPSRKPRGDGDDHDAVLIDREKLLYAGHPSIASSPLALFLVVGGITGGIWLYALDFAFTAACFGLALLGMAYLSFMRFTQDYRITPRRIEVITGLLARSSNEVRIEDIRSINVTCRGFTGVIGIGTVDFFTSGDNPEVSFRKIWAAAKVKTLIRRLQDTL